MKQLRDFEGGAPTAAEIVLQRWKEADRLLVVIKGHLDDYKDGEEASRLDSRMLTNVVKWLEEAAKCMSVDVPSVLKNIDIKPAVVMLGGRDCQIGHKGNAHAQD